MQDWASVLERDAVGVLSLNKLGLSLFPSNHPFAPLLEPILYYGLMETCETSPSSSCSLFSSIVCSPTVRCESVVVSSY